MEITEVRVFPKEGQDKKLKAYATITFDNKFVVRNIKIIQGNNGLFIAMPSRKNKKPCPQCSFKNEVGSKFCNSCGVQLPESQEVDETPDGRNEHRDIAHPINQEFRDYLQNKIIETFNKEVSS